MVPVTRGWAWPHFSIRVPSFLVVDLVLAKYHVLSTQDWVSPANPVACRESKLMFETSGLSGIWISLNSSLQLFGFGQWFSVVNSGACGTNASGAVFTSIINNIGQSSFWQPMCPY